METPGWENLWMKHYNNRSDERWKTKSLNPMSPEQYAIPLPKVTKPIQGKSHSIQNLLRNRVKIIRNKNRKVKIQIKSNPFLVQK